MDPLFAKIVFILGYVIPNFAIRVPHARHYRKAAIRVRRTTRRDAVLLFVTVSGGFLIPLFYVFTPIFWFADYSLPLWVGIPGIGVLVLADWVFWKSHRDLGIHWSPTLELREGHRLVTAGIYRRIRHPMYLSIWLLVISQAMILPNYIAGFSGIAGFAILYFLRVGQEEKMMIDEFGSEYEQYMQRTGRLLPKF